MINGYEVCLPNLNLDLYTQKKSGAKTVPQRSRFGKRLLFGKKGPFFLHHFALHKKEAPLDAITVPILYITVYISEKVP